MANITQVIVPLVVAKQEDGSDVYLYQGVPVPKTVPEDEVKRLKAGGFIKTFKVEEPPAGDAGDGGSGSGDGGDAGAGDQK